MIIIFNFRYSVLSERFAKKFLFLKIPIYMHDSYRYIGLKPDSILIYNIMQIVLGINNCNQWAQ